MTEIENITFVRIKKKKTAMLENNEDALLEAHQQIRKDDIILEKDTE